jgi:hypothetical protein
MSKLIQQIHTVANGTGNAVDNKEDANEAKTHCREALASFGVCGHGR